MGVIIFPTSVSLNTKRLAGPPRRNFRNFAEPRENLAELSPSVSVTHRENGTVVLVVSGRVLEHAATVRAVLTREV